MPEEGPDNMPGPENETHPFRLPSNEGGEPSPPPEPASSSEQENPFLLPQKEEKQEIDPHQRNVIAAVGKQIDSETDPSTEHSSSLPSSENEWAESVVDQVDPTDPQSLPDNLRNADMMDYFERMFGGSKEGKKPAEILASSEDPVEVMRAVHELISPILQEHLWWNKDPNVYHLEYPLIESRHRESYLKKVAAGFEKHEKWTNRFEEDSEKSEEKILALINAYGFARERLLAVGINFLPKLAEQRKWGTDLDQYAGKYFTYQYKQEIPSDVYRIMLNTPEIRKGYEKHGHQVEEAYGALRSMAQGQAVVEVNNEMLEELGVEYRLEDGETKQVRMPNPFSMPANSGLMKFAFKYYVIPELRKMKTYEDTFRGRMRKRLEDEASWEAAEEALALFWHTDEDMMWAVARSSGATLEISDIHPSDLADINLETGPFAVDAAKMAHADVRQRSEHGLPTRREHIRAAGNPMLYPATPKMTAAMFDVVTSELPIPQKISEQLNERFGDTWKIEGDKIKLSVNSWKFDDEALIPVEVNGDIQWVPVEKDSVNLRDIPWNDVKVVSIGELVDKDEVDEQLEPMFEQLGNLEEDLREEMTRDRRDVRKIRQLQEQIKEQEIEIHDKEEEAYLHFAMGPQKNAYEVPYKLQMFYAWSSLYSLFFGNPSDVYDKLAPSYSMRSINKKFDVALGILANAYDLDRDTVNDFGNYLRAVLIGATAAAMTDDIKSSEDRPQEVSTQVNQKRQEYIAGDTALAFLLESARVSTFLPVDRQTNKLDSKWKDLAKDTYKRIVNEHKRAPKPSESGVFSQQQVDRLQPLYSFGA